MKIANGYNDKETHIRIHKRENLTAEFWIEQDGLQQADKAAPGSETLAYITLGELLTLRDEINNVIQELVA